MHCNDGACVSLETSIRTNLAPADQPRLEGFESVREQNKDRAKRRANAEVLIAELQDTRDPESFASLTIELVEEPFDYSVLRGTRGAQREGVLAARQAQLEPVQHAFLDRIAELGGRPMGVSKLTNQVDLNFPVGRLGELLEMDDVVGISLGDVGGGESAANGWVIRNTAFGQTVPDHDGGQGNRYGSNNEIQVAIIEYETPLNIGHMAWRDWNGGPSRIVDTRHCKWQYYFPFGGMVCVSGASGSLQGHGTSVTGVLLGSIEQGQDVNFPSIPGNHTGPQIQRSGIAREAEAHYYLAESSWALRAAIEHAVAVKADVINMSMHVGDDACSGSVDYGGVRGAVMAAENAGVVLLAASGNDQDGRPCSDGNDCAINFPATLTDVMAIGGVEHNAAGPYYHENGFFPRSECGRTQTAVAGGASLWAPMIDLVSHYTVTGLPGSGTIGYFSHEIFGTSFSTPIVSGAAALTRHWMHNLGWNSYDDAYAVRANLLVMGDASWQLNAGNPNANPVVRDYADINWGFGYGRLLYRWPDPDTTQLGSHGSWGYHSFTMNSGQTVSFTLGDGTPLSTWVLGWKMAVIADENTYGEMPDLNVRIVDTCSPGSPPVQNATRLAGRWKIVLDRNVHWLTGRCLEARITANATSGPVEVHVADYGFSNSISRHLF